MSWLPELPSPGEEWGAIVIPVRRGKIVEEWEGDYQRGPNDDGHRWGMFEALFAPPQFEDVLDQAVLWCEAAERCLPQGWSWGRYVCDVLEAFEDDDVPPEVQKNLERLKKLVRSRFAKLEFKEEEGEPGRDWVVVPDRAKWFPMDEPPSLQEFATCGGVK